MLHRVLAVGFAAALPLAGAGIGQVQAALDIVGGELTSAWPGVGVVAALDVSGKTIGTCTGTLLDGTHVLTAAHCVAPVIEADAFMFEVGPDLAEPMVQIPVAEVEYHPGWSGGLEHDLAILTLGTAVEATQFAFDIAADAPATGDPVFLMGYGGTASGGQKSGIKRVGTATVGEASPAFFVIDGPAAACDGDSGGPVFVYGDTGFPVLHGVILAALEECTQTIALRIDAEFDSFIAPSVEAPCIVDDDSGSCDGLLRNGFEPSPGHP
jgi:secreted trypsin-like serine protease